MPENVSQEIRSELMQDGHIVLSIAEVAKPSPADKEVLIKVEAAPINPSDLGLLVSFAADLKSLTMTGSGASTRTTMTVHPKLIASMKARVGQSMQVGNEGAGVVVAAGANAAHLIGKTVGVAGGAMYSHYRCVRASNCLVMDDEITPAQAASSFVNPLTALGFIETMRLENHSALVNTAASSNLGQMLVKICHDENIPLVNIVRKTEHVETLKKINAQYICNTSDPDFMAQLVAALIATGATLGFDATGGGNDGKLPGQILSAMEIAANTNAKEFSRYGSETYKQVYIYGGLDQSPTVLNRSFGMQWGLGGWLLTPMLQRIGAERFQALRQRVTREIKTTFASHYTDEISLEEMLQPDMIRAYTQQRTGQKYLVTPHKD